MKDLTGHRFGRLTASHHEYRVGGTGRKYTGYVCTCDCGGSVWVRAEDLRHGKQVTCGKTCGTKTYTTVADYLANTVKRGSCQEWKGALTVQGYGRMGVSPNAKYIHREVFRLTHGYEPEVVMHTCDNRKCASPAHLKAGTHRDNFDDMRSKRRHAHGEGAGPAKLTNSEVIAIRDKHAKGVSVSELARNYSVARATIYSICTRKTWRHI
jgi:hypothetical protein